MSQIPGGRRVLAGLLTSSLLMALAVLPASPFQRTAVRAVGEPSDCAFAEGEGSGAEWCQLSPSHFPSSHSSSTGRVASLQVPAGTYVHDRGSGPGLGLRERGRGIIDGCAADGPRSP